MLVKSKSKFHTLSLELHLPYRCSIYESESENIEPLVVKEFWSKKKAARWGKELILEWSTASLEGHVFYVTDREGNILDGDSTQKLVNVRFVLSSSINR